MDELRTILNIDQTMASESYYQTCRYRLVGEPAARALLNVTYTDFYPERRYEGQLRAAHDNSRKRSTLHYEVFETDDVGSRAYEYTSFLDERPVFMQKCFLSRSRKLLVTIQLKARQIDSRTNRFYVPNSRHLMRITKVVEKNLEEQLAEKG